MKETGFLKTAVSYFRRYGGIVLQFGLFAAIFAAVLSLYDLPLDAVGYAALLCLCTAALFAAGNFRQYWKRHRALAGLRGSITVRIDELPAPRDLIEEDYQRLLAVLHEDEMKLALNADNARRDMVDYYTLWAHQIKTPIAAMRLLLQSGEAGHGEELSMELFQIEQYVEMVLQYLRLDSDFTDYVLKNYDLDRIVRQAVRKYAKVFIRKKIGLDFSKLNCEVLTDEKWLVFVVEQILSNALKYTRKGKISIYMKRGQSKTLVFEDTGIGVRAEDLPRVFDKGFTGCNGRADKKSTGIGLYLCKRILTKLSHTIDVESEAGKGTKVEIGFDTVKLSVE